MLNQDQIFRAEGDTTDTPRNSRLRGFLGGVGSLILLLGLGFAAFDGSSLPSGESLQAAVVTNSAITSFSPVSGAAGTQIGIQTSNFSNLSGATVKFGSVASADVQIGGGGNLIARVPSGVSGSIYLTVSAGGQTAISSAPFTIATTGTNTQSTPMPTPSTSTTATALTITDFGPKVGKAGDTIYIQGTNFDTQPARNTVMFGDKQATVQTLTGTKENSTLAVIVPAGISGNVAISVTTTRGTALGQSLFEVPSTLPVVTGFTPTQGAVGDTLYIEGSNFSENPRQNIVKFAALGGGVVRALIVETIYQGGQLALKVEVPKRATTGHFTIEVDGQVSDSGKDFTVVQSLAATPQISNLSSIELNIGDTLVIEGVGLLDRSTSVLSATGVTVFFNGAPAVVTNFSTGSSGQDILMVTVPAAATDGYLTVTNKTNTAISPVSLVIKNTSTGLNAPQIDATRTRVEPAAPTELTTSLVFQTFVSDLNGATDIATVNLDLSLLGGSSGNAMTPGVLEGSGQFFSLTSTLARTLSADKSPYLLPLTATDISGKTARSELMLCVDGCPADLTPTGIRQGDTWLSDLTVDSINTLTLRFTKPVLTSTFDQTGANFILSSAGDIAPVVISAALDQTRQIVTLTTTNQIPDLGYVLSVTGLLGGNGRSVSITNGVGEFAGFSTLKAPINVQTAASSAGLTVTFDIPVDSFATGHRVLYSTVSGSYARVVDTAAATSALLSDLTAGQRYYIVVQSYDATGQLSPQSAEITTIYNPNSSVHGSAPVSTTPAVLAGVIPSFDFGQGSFAPQSGVYATASVPNTFVAPRVSFQADSYQPTSLVDVGPAETLALTVWASLLLAGGFVALRRRA